jgi:hypothetical protein
MGYLALETAKVRTCLVPRDAEAVGEVALIRERDKGVISLGW